MIRGVTRLLLLRFLPRRLLPVLTAWEIVQLVRNRRRAQAIAVDPDAELTSERGRGRTTRRRPPTTR
jgi:hypothetical protein